MLNIFNRAVLCSGCSAEDAAKIWANLRAAGIKYRVKTDTHGPTKPGVRMANGGRMGSFASGGTTGSSIPIGVPASWSDGGTTNYYYTIYVSKKDFARAKELTDTAQ